MRGRTTSRRSSCYTQIRRPKRTDPGWCQRRIRSHFNSHDYFDETMQQPRHTIVRGEARERRGKPAPCVRIFALESFHLLIRIISRVNICLPKSDLEPHMAGELMLGCRHLAPGHCWRSSSPIRSGYMLLSRSPPSLSHHRNSNFGILIRPKFCVSTARRDSVASLTSRHRIRVMERKRSSGSSSKHSNAPISTRSRVRRGPSTPELVRYMRKCASKN